MTLDTRVTIIVVAVPVVVALVVSLVLWLTRDRADDESEWPTEPAEPPLKPYDEKAAQVEFKGHVEPSCRGWRCPPSLALLPLLLLPWGCAGTPRVSMTGVVIPFDYLSPTWGGAADVYPAPRHLSVAEEADLDKLLDDFRMAPIAPSRIFYIHRDLCPAHGPEPEARATTAPPATLAADVAAAAPDTAHWFRCWRVCEERRGEWVPQDEIH